MAALALGLWVTKVQGGWLPSPPTEALPAAPRAAMDAQPARSSPSLNIKAPGLGPVGKALCVGATSAALACSGPQPQVRSAPPSESCPPGALEAMKKLGIRIDERQPVLFPGTDREVITVRQGDTELELIGPIGKLPDSTRLMGRLIFGDRRVYGRITEAQSPDGERFPVCMELWGEDIKRGLVREPGGGPDSARVFSVGTVEAEMRFE